MDTKVIDGREGRVRRSREYMEMKRDLGDALASASFKEKHPTKAVIREALSKAYQLGMNHGAEVILSHPEGEIR